MKKKVYDAELRKEQENSSFEDLFQKLKAMEMVETHDSDIARLVCVVSNEKFSRMFKKYDELKEKFTYRKAEELYDLIEECKDEWYNIISQMNEIIDPYKNYRAIEAFKERVRNAMDPDSEINIK